MSDTVTPDNLRGLLGELERELAEWAWRQPLGELTVRQAYVEVGLMKQPPLAYTTIMTVMSHLADKGIFSRRREGKTYYYHVVQTQAEFIAAAAARQATQMVANFGDIALAQFAEQLAADPARLKQIREILAAAEGEA